MVQTNSHRFNTHVKRLALSITRLLITSRIITQYFNHLLLYNFTTSPLSHYQLSNFAIHGFCLFVCFVALRPKSTAMVIAGRSVHLTTLFPGQA